MACNALTIRMASLVAEADEIAARLTKEEEIEIITPFGTQKNDANPGKTILALGALAFLISRLVK